ncbi:TPA: hypothetical protein HA244_04140 [Candidatus Micrarchaeota archaeon]|nr:hypothetical protein [Candidatus Micrarchaeota archaeon]
MAHSLVNAFTVAALVFMAMGMLKPTDFLLVLGCSLFLTKAAPALHK